MPRQARIVLPNEAHHVTQRGNYQMAVFDKSENYRKYIELVNEYQKEYKVEILAYCLMSNHVHFIVRPRTEDGLGKFFNTVHMRYAHYLNRLRGVKGHLWQGRFYSCVLDEAHLYRGMRYVEMNPVRARMVKKAWEYEWSSAGEHVGEKLGQVIRLRKGYGGMSVQEWKEYLQELDEEGNDAIRKRTRRGLVMGESKFIEQLEKRLKRSLEYRSWGRPRKL